MPEVNSGGVTISYDSVGEGQPLILLHGVFCDRSWWAEPGYIDELGGEYRLISIDIRGHGDSDKPHDPAAYTYDALIADVLAVADAEGVNRFSIWGHSYGGWIAWMTAAAVPERVGAIATTGAWDPRPDPGPSPDSDWVEALRRGGTPALIEQFELEDGEAFDREFPPWARTVTLRGDAEAWLATYEASDDGFWVSEEELRSFPVPVLIIAGEFDDPDDDAATIAAMLPNGRSLRLPGLGHGGSCASSTARALTVPAVRELLDRWCA